MHLLMKNLSSTVNHQKHIVHDKLNISMLTVWAIYSNYKCSYQSYEVCNERRTNQDGNDDGQWDSKMVKYKGQEQTGRALHRQRE